MFPLDTTHIFHVAKTGNDANAGLAQQYPINLAADADVTIAASVTAATAGDTVIIHPGDYDENVALQSKALTLIGTSRTHSKVIPTNNHGISAGSNVILKNLAVEALGASKYGVTGGIAARTNIVIEDCDLYGNFNGVYLHVTGSGDIFVSNSRIRGERDGADLWGVTRGHFRDTTFFATGTHTSATTYRGIYECANSVFDNCHIYAVARNASGVSVTGVLHDIACQLVYNNCVFYVSAGASVDGTVYGVYVNHADAYVVLNNCVIRTVATGTPSDQFDLVQVAGRLVVNNCSYDTSFGTITSVQNTTDDIRNNTAVNR